MQKFISTAVAGLLLASSAHAVPNPLEPRATDAALEPWVTINEDGKPATITPVLSTISGTPTVISGAPHDLTANVFTYTSYGKVITSTGSAPLPTPTGDDDAGAFPPCHNLDGPNAPWCLPKANEPLYVGTRYYFTWDPEFFKSAPNATVRIVASYLNSTTGEVEPDIAAFESPPLPAADGFWTQSITDEYLRHQGSKNLTIVLTSALKGKQKLTPIKVTTRPGPEANGRGKTPHGAAIYIALPTVFGFIILCVVGTCLWNRHHRHIKLGKVMGRNYDVSKSGSGSRRRRFGIGKKRAENKMSPNERIQLMEQEIEAEGGEVYRDFPDPANRPRRDSDALGSLAGTPTEDRRMNLDGGNAFRNELRRQADERS